MPQAASAPSAMRPRAAPPPATGAQSGAGEFRRRFAKGAGLSEAHLAHHDDGDLAELLGQAMSIVAENLRQLHAARAQSKGMMRSSNQTMIQALDNNPLRFTPSAEEALRIMFGPASKSYLDASRALESSFSDLKKHQVQTFSAMQAAVRQIMAELEPKAIEAKVGASGGVSALMGGRKAKLWEHYATVWEARAGKHEQGMLAVFMLAFADAYDKSS